MALSLAVDREYVYTDDRYCSQGDQLRRPQNIFDVEAGSSFEEVTRANNGGGFLNVSDYEADLAKAKGTLAEAGYPNGEKASGSLNI